MLPRVNTTVWMHHVDTNKMHLENARGKLRKNATNYVEQLIGAKLNETAAPQKPS